MQFLRANTAVDVLIGPFVDVTDGSTAETGLTLDVELSKLGQALANKNDATTPVHDGAGTIDGHYNCELDATDTDTEGTMVLLAFASGALIVRHEFMVLAEAAWDSMFVAKDAGFMDVNVKTVGRADTQETEADNLESACANYSVTRGLTGTALPAAVADAAGGVAISDLGGLDIDATDANVTLILEDTGTTIPGTITTVDNEIATIDGIVDNILIDTGTTLDGRIPAALVGGAMDCNVSAMQAGTVNGTSIADSSITAAKLASNVITSTKIATGAITATSIASNTITAAKLSASCITTTQIDATFLADINAEVDTALRTTTDGEPAQGTPGATISLEEKISWLYKAWRNRTTSTATQYNLYNDDTTTIDTKATLADDGTTASRTEMVTGP